MCHKDVLECTHKFLHTIHAQLEDMHKEVHAEMTKVHEALQQEDDAEWDGEDKNCEDGECEVK